MDQDDITSNCIGYSKLKKFDYNIIFERKRIIDEL